MLWWLIGAWLASGLAIPILWLLSLAGRRVFAKSPKDVPAIRAPAPPRSSKRAAGSRGHKGRPLLSGLTGIGALILLFFGSLSDPITTMGNWLSAFAVAEAPVSQPAMTPSPVEADLAPVNPPDRSGEETVGHGLAGQDIAVSEIQSASALTATSAVPPPAYAERPTKHVSQHGRRGPVSAFVAQSNSGTWLFPPNPNSDGGNN
jgi:hypothetical protein